MNFFSSLQTGQPQHISRRSPEAQRGECQVQPWVAPCPAELTQLPGFPDLWVISTEAEVEVHVLGTVTTPAPIPLHPGSATPRSPVPPPQHRAIGGW